MDKKILAERLKLGDTIGIIGPSGPINEEYRYQFDNGIKKIEELGFKIKIAKNIFSRKLGYGSTPEEKIEDIETMFLDKEVKAILCTRGGFNANNILYSLNFNIIKNNPKIFVGFSDIIILINSIQEKSGLITFHGNNLMAGFGEDCSDYDIGEFMDRFVEGKIGEIKHNSKRECIRKGVVKGKLIGGNVSRLSLVAGTKFFPNFENKILILEDFDKTTPPQRVESTLYHLEQLGAFEKIKGLWLGNYNHKSGIKYEDIVMNVLGKYDFPILKCDDFGHNTANTVIPIGVEAELDATNKKITILEKCLK